MDAEKLVKEENTEKVIKEDWAEKLIKEEDAEKLLTEDGAEKLINEEDAEKLVKVEDAKMLLEHHNCEMITDELKELFHQPCEEKEMEKFSKGKYGENKNKSLLKSRPFLFLKYWRKFDMLL